MPRLVVLLSVALASACTEGRSVEPAESETSSAIQNVRFHVEELTCEGCAAQVREILQPLGGIEHVDVDVRSKTVSVELDTLRVTPADVVAALAREKYTARPSPAR